MNFAKSIAWLTNQGIRSGQINTEIKWLCEKINRFAPKCMVEIGSRHGGSLYMLARECQEGATVIAVDLEGQGWGKKNSGKSLENVVEKLKKEGYQATWIKGKSGDPETVKEVRVLSRGEIDFLFIDADHRYEEVLQDWANYQGMVRPGGIIGFHDIAHDDSESIYGMRGVDRLWRILKPGYETDEIIAGPGIGILRKEKR